MANVKLSQIAVAGVTPVSGTQFVAVTGGTTDNLYTVDEIADFVASEGSLLSGLPAGSAIADTDLFYSAEGSGPYTSVKVTALQIKTYIGSAGMSIGGAVAGGTAGSVLFIDGSGNLAQDNAKFFWDDSGHSLELKGGSTLAFGGSSSGTVTVGTQAAAGTWTMTLPTTAGTNLYVLQTDGTGITSWVPQSGGGGGMAIGGAVTGSTPGSVLFIDGSSNLAQDNSNFFWDDTHDSLKIQGQNAIFRVPNVSGDNWFEAGAGNFTVSGAANFGTGSGALASLTSGANNLATGTNALNLCNTGNFNTAIGDFALALNTGGSSNTAIGNQALFHCTTGNFNFAIGASNLGNLTTGQGNVAVGTNVGLTINTGSFNTLIGYSTAANFDGDNNIVLGHIPFQNLSSGSLNVVLGFGAGFSASTATSNILIGAGGNTFTSGNHNVLLGDWGGGSSSLNNVIAFSISTALKIDYNYISASIWSIQESTSPSGLHLYNTWDGNPSPTNYERALLDWNPTSNVFRLASQAGGTGTVRLIAIDGFQKAGAPAAGDLPSGTWALINDTSGGNTWLVYNNAGTIRKVQLT